MIKKPAFNTFVLSLIVLFVFGLQIMPSKADTENPAASTGTCRNIHTQGIEYFSPVEISSQDSDKWRGDLIIEATNSDGIISGKITAVELEVINDLKRYQCTNEVPGTNEFSCNSFPINAAITGVFILYKPSVPADTQVTFTVREAIPADSTPFWYADAIVNYPPYPCSVNYEIPNDLVTPTRSTMVFYTKTDCNGNTFTPSTTELALTNQVLRFYEKSDQYAIVNIIEGDTIKPERLRMTGFPQATFDYTITLRFQDSNPDDSCFQPDNSQGCYHEVSYIYDYDPFTKNYTETITPITTDTTVITSSGEKYGTWTDLTNTKLPLKLVDGQIYNIKTQEKDGWGIPSFPTDIDLLLRFWYQNTEGTLGFENAIFHFERNLNIQFSPTCKTTAPASTLYDPCQPTTQGFFATLNEPFIIYDGRDPVTLPWSTHSSTLTLTMNTGTIYHSESDAGVIEWLKDHKWDTEGFPFNFVTRKCVDSNCDWVTGTGAYPRRINFSDGGGSNHTYTTRRLDSNSRTMFRVKPYGTENHPFAISSITLVADEPGTYVIYPFVKYSGSTNNLISDSDYFSKYGPIYVTVNDKDQLDTCASLANNGYFSAYLDEMESSEGINKLPFKAIVGEEEAWIENRSPQPLDFPFMSKWSNLAQGMKVSGLSCKFTALASAAQPEDGYCKPENIHVPRYTSVYITGGILTVDESQTAGEYYPCYGRPDTWNISHLFIGIRDSRISTGSCGINTAYRIEGETIAFSKSGSGDASYWGNDCRDLFKNQKTINKVTVSGGIIVNDAREMFKSFSNVIEMDLSGFDMSHVTSLNFMFDGCSNLQTLNVSGWNTTAVTSMEGVFRNCLSLTDLDLSSWDTSNVTTMRMMFEMDNLIYRMPSSLNSLNVSTWNTSKVTMMDDMFYCCEKLSSLDARNWDTSKVTSSIRTFAGCNQLTTLKLGENTLGQNIFVTLPGYNQNWYYIAQTAAANNPMDYGQQMGNSELFTSYVPDSMAGVWSMDPDYTVTEKILTLPTALQELSESAFEGAVSFEEVFLPDGLTLIGSKAFANCAALKLIHLPKNDITIIDDAFANTFNVIFISRSDNEGINYARRNNIAYRIEP